ncbi:Ribosome-binding factor A [Nymphon striatum]|nr:Ribosome-binding factor A [Nymphon striatum]
MSLLLMQTRKLAAHLGVSRITVTLAYTELLASDYLSSKGRSGYFVSENAPDPPAFDPEPRREDRNDQQGVRWQLPLNPAGHEMKKPRPEISQGGAFVSITGWASLLAGVQALWLTNNNKSKIIRLKQTRGHAFHIRTCPLCQSHARRVPVQPVRKTRLSTPGRPKRPRQHPRRPLRRQHRDRPSHGPPALVRLQGAFYPMPTLRKSASAPYDLTHLMAKNSSHEARGPSQRQLRVGELIRRTLSEVLARGDVHDPDLNRMSITVGEVRTSPDLKVATAYVLPLGGKGQEDVLKLLAKNKFELRRIINKKLTLKYSPDLRFRLDETFDQMDDTRRLFSQESVRRDLEPDAPTGRGQWRLSAALQLRLLLCLACCLQPAHPRWTAKGCGMTANGIRCACTTKTAPLWATTSKTAQNRCASLPNAGPGNFGLLPNGILCLRDGRADVIETLKFRDTAPDCTHATQSGPMLVIDGELHPRFLPDSTSRYIRNGVGTSADGTQAVFVISDTSVTFHEFGSFFRDALEMPNALFLDGNVSRLYAPELGRADSGRRMGPIVGVVIPQN